MKKSLVLAMAMALGVTASAYAANPFSDVPAGHWAYDSIDKLAAAGVVDGMGDGTFQGDRTMTRYEMAQIVAKAMAKGANVEKLAAEFADELDALGVRVAALEKKTDNLKITGQIRYDYESGHGGFVAVDAKGKRSAKVAPTHLLRTRLFLNGQINEDWSYYARLQNDVNFQEHGGKQNNFDMNQVGILGRVGGLKVRAGRLGQVLGNALVFDNTMEMIEASYGKKVNVAAFYGQATDSMTVMGNQFASAASEDNELWGVKVSTKIGVVDVKADYIDVKDKSTESTSKQEVASLTAQLPVAKNLNFAGTIIKANEEKDQEENGYVVGLSYKGAKADKVGSWGLWANYYDQGNRTYISPTMKTTLWKAAMDVEGFKGYGAGVTYTLAKNIVYSLDWYDFEAKKGGEKAQSLYSRVQFTF